MRLGAVWIRDYEDKDGNKRKYLSVALQWPGVSVNAAAFKTDEKKGDNSPDYFIEWNPQKRENGNGAGGGGSQKFEDDIPF